MSDADSAKPGGEAEAAEVLRAKYHDYCSAQLADLVLYLTPDEMYLLARKVARDRIDDPTELSYAYLVGLATEWLSRKVMLPPYDVWVRDYREHPELYEDYFMGLWESSLKVSEGH